jgi:hypothetical protein
MTNKIGIIEALIMENEQQKPIQYTKELMKKKS